MRSVAVLLAALLLVSACRTGEEPEDDPDGTGLPGQAPGAEDDGPEVTAWFVRSDESGLWVEPGAVRLDEPPTDPLHAALDALVAGRAQNPELARRLAPRGTSVRAVDVDQGVATIDVSSFVRGADRSAEEEVAFAQQLAHTATQSEDVEAVQLLVTGSPVDVLWGHVDWSEPLTPDPAVLSPVIIEEPSWGAVQPTGSVTVSGSLATGDSTVDLRLIDPTGTVVEEATAAATPGGDGDGQRGRWEHTFSTGAEAAGKWAVGVSEGEPPAEADRTAFRTVVRFEVED